MPRKANATIGTLTDPHKGAVCAVRRDAGGRLYYVTPLGKCTLYTPEGQDWILEHSLMWGPGGAPPGTPDWIANGRASPPDTFNEQDQNPAAPPAAEPVPDDAAPVTSEDTAAEPDPVPVQPDDDDGVFGFT